MKSIYLEDNWGKLQEEKDGGIFQSYTFEANGGKIVYPYVRREAGIVDGVMYYDLVTPRGMCGPYIYPAEDISNCELVSGFDQAFQTFCDKEGIVAEYIKFSPWCDDCHCFEAVYEVEHYSNVYCNDVSIDFFNEEYSATRRNNVRRARKNGVTVTFDHSPEALEGFLKLYRYTEDKYSVSDYYRLDMAFLERYYELLPDRVFIANAIYEGHIISSAMFLVGRDIGHYHYCGSDPDYMYLNPNPLLLYETSLYLARLGVKLMDMGSAVPDSNLQKYKLGFVKKSKPRNYYTGKKVRDADTYKKLVEQSGGARDKYFPAYRR